MTSIVLSPINGFISFSYVNSVISPQIDFDPLWFNSNVSKALASLSIPSKIL